jgi:hypothetical protein
MPRLLDASITRLLEHDAFGIDDLPFWITLQEGELRVSRFDANATRA